MIGGMMFLFATFANSIDCKRFVSRLKHADEDKIKRFSSRQDQPPDVAYAYALGQIYNAHGGRGTLKLAMLTMVD